MKRKYKAPGVYSHFIPAQQSVNSSTPLRVMALVGTGKQFFEKTNVFITRSKTSIYDELPDTGITEIYSVTENAVSSRNAATNKVYSHYKLQDDSIIWEPIAGSQYGPTIDTKMGLGDASFLTNVSTTVADPLFVVNESYKVQITNPERENVGTFTVTKLSNNELIGEFVATTTGYTNIIPGINLKISSTFILNGSYPTSPKSKTKIGDYAIITTTTAKCHVDPVVSLIESNDSNDPGLVVVNGGSYFNIVGDGKSVISTPSNWPFITNQFSLTKNFAGVKFNVLLYKDGVLTTADNLFSKFNIEVTGTTSGSAVTTSQVLFDSASSVASNAYDITPYITTTSTLATGDNFSLTYSYVLKDDLSTDQSDFVIHLDIIDTTITTPVTRIASMDNVIFVRNNVIPHVTDSYNSIFSRLIKDVKIVNSQTIESANYKIKINNVANNEITIYDMTHNKAIGTYSTDVNAEFREAIPGISFTLYSFSEIEGLIEMFDTKDINDVTGATVYISTLEGISNPEVPESDAGYYVSYKYAKAEEDYNPKVFYDYDEVLTNYGAYSITAAGTVINSLSLAAEIAFTNGACPIVCVQSKNETPVEMNKAIDKLGYKIDNLNNINSIVPISTSKIVGKHLLQHINLYSSSDYNLPRMGYVAAELNEPINKDSTISDTTLGSMQAAEAYNDERLVYVVPGKVAKNITDTLTGYQSLKLLPACYLATAVAAVAMKNDPAEPLTNKEILGFQKIPVNFSEPEMNELAASGCLVVKQDGNKIRIRHGITSHGCIDTLADIQANEITLIQIKDYVIEGARTKCGELYIGGKMKPTILHEVEYGLTQLFNQYMADDIIIGIEGLTVKRDQDDPRQINVKFLIEAVYPLNYIDISFGFSTNIS